jgi:hypothetical protein
MSGLAVNHIADWDPNFVNYEREYTINAPLPDSDAKVAAAILAESGIREEPLDVYRVDEDALEITLAAKTLHVRLDTRVVYEEGQKERVFLRVANWLHLNRGKKAWTWFADGYAVVLLVLATSGLFMIPGRKGIRRRGAVLVAVGIAVPLGYLTWAGAP